MSIIDDLLTKNGVPVGTFLFSKSQASLEVIADAGFDFVVIGTEHFTVNPERIEHLITVAEASAISPVVRVGEETHMISRVLDTGAGGIIAPMINTAKEARKIVKAAKFPPIGERGVGNPRSTIYGVRGADYMDGCYEKQNEDQAVIVQIETEQALDNIQDIATVEGVDSLFIGPWDLSHSLDKVGDKGREKLLEEGISKALSQTKEKDVPVGIFAWDGGQARERIEGGFDYVVCAGDVIFLTQSAKQALEEITSEK